MFSKKYEQRLYDWREFRKSLETDADPLTSVINFYSKVPLVKYQCDPYDSTSWPSPWEVIQDNVYCPFIKILAMGYSLQLTDKFTGSSIEIHIKHDPAASIVYYLLYVDDYVIGFTEDTYVHSSEIPKNLVSQLTVPLKLHQ